MSDEDEKSRPEEEALCLKTLAEEKYSSGDLNSALNYATRAHELHPSINGLSEMLTALKILLGAAATPVSETSSTPILDYYRILQVERFSHINSIKKQYKKLALTLHPDKNPSAASEEAFKLVGEAARVLSDKVRRKEYDMRLRIAMQSEAAEEVGLETEEAGLETEEAGETFSTACSACRLLHQFERKYLGHNLMCPNCKKTFKAMEVEEDRSNGGDEGSMENSEGIGEGQTRVSARIRERVAKGEHEGVVEKFGLGRKRKIHSVGEVSERSEEKVTKMKKVENVGTSYAKNELRSSRVGGKVRRGPAKAPESSGVETVESEKTAEDSGEETMTLSQMRTLVMKKKKKLVQAKSRIETEVNGEKLEAKEKEVDIEEMEKEKEKEKDKGKEKEKDKGKEKPNRRRVSKNRKLDDADRHYSKTGKDRSLEKGDLEVLMEEEEEDGKEKEIEATRGKRERRRTSKYGNLDFVKTNNTSKNQVDTEIESLVASEKGSLGIMPVEDSDFYDFDKDRKERSFKKGQVWAVYDDDDGMPRHYGLIDKVVSLNPFQVMFIWLRFQSNKDEELVSWPNTGCHVSCGIFQLSTRVTVKYLKMFSHLVDCERATKELYRIYPKKGSVWAMYNNNAPQTSEIDQGVKDTRSYDIVILLSSYDDMYGLSVGYLDKVPGFRTVFKRKEVGANGVICLGPKDVKLLSHQIPARKLSGDESPGLPKDCWELDPGSLTPKLLMAS